MDYALSIDPDQPKHDTQANTGRHVSPPVDFLFLKALLYYYIPLRWKVSAQISPGR